MNMIKSKYPCGRSVYNSERNKGQPMNVGIILPHSSDEILYPLNDPSISDLNVKVVIIDDLGPNHEGFINVRLPKNVEYLDFFTEKINSDEDVNFDILQIKAPGLRGIDLGGLPVTSISADRHGKVVIGVANIDNCIIIDVGRSKRLKYLEVYSHHYHRQVTNVYLTELTGLETLYTDYSIFYNMNKPRIDRSLVNLRNLSLELNEDTPKDVIAHSHKIIPGLKELRSLNFSLQKDDDPSEIINQRNLENLSIESHGMIGDLTGIESGITLNKMKFFNINNGDPDTIDHILQRCPNIESLNVMLSYINVTTLLVSRPKKMRFMDVVIIDDSLDTAPVLEIDDLYFNRGKGMKALMEHVGRIRKLETFSPDDHLSNFIEKGYLKGVENLELNSSGDISDYIDYLPNMKSLDVFFLSTYDIENNIFDKFDGDFKFQGIYSRGEKAHPKILQLPHVRTNKYLYDKLKKLIAEEL